MLGTTSPRSVAAAMPRLTDFLSTISCAASSHRALSSGVRRIARQIALATISVGETLSPANAGLALSVADQIDRARHVERHPLGDVRGGERRPDHRLGGHLAHPLDRDADVAGVVAGVRGLGSAPRSVGLDVGAGDDVAGRRRRRPGRPPGPWRACGPAAWPAARGPATRRRRLGGRRDPAGGAATCSIRRRRTSRLGARAVARPASPDVPARARPRPARSPPRRRSR